jgi:TPR repeat protein
MAEPHVRFDDGAAYEQMMGIWSRTSGPKNDDEARVLFEKAAAQGHIDAMVWAGAFWEIGGGGPRDDTRAKAYYEKAAAGAGQGGDPSHRLPARPEG